ncbi:MAG TPA: hypothetical protein VKC57_09170, partial [Ktedonobacterales bacterium]|nr:hypothetical protein [Ktedonobacterales bacterium]
MGRDVAAVPLRMHSDVGRPPQRPTWLTYAPDAVLVAVAMVGAALLINHLWYMPNGDVNYYSTYAGNFWRGNPATGANPFRTLPTEYPPLALLPFTLALLPPITNTLLVFGFWMLLLVVAGYVAIARMSSRRNALAFVAYLVLGEAVIVLGRYDLVPALVTL